MIFLNLYTVGNYESSDCSADNGENVVHQWKTFNLEIFGLQRFEIINFWKTSTKYAGILKKQNVFFLR